jgi:hypothetical protein
VLADESNIDESGWTVWNAAGESRCADSFL